MRLHITNLPRVIVEHVAAQLDDISWARCRASSSFFCVDGPVRQRARRYSCFTSLSIASEARVSGALYLIESGRLTRFAKHKMALAAARSGRVRVLNLLANAIDDFGCTVDEFALDVCLDAIAAAHPRVVWWAWRRLPDDAARKRVCNAVVGVGCERLVMQFVRRGILDVEQHKLHKACARGQTSTARRALALHPQSGHSICFAAATGDLDLVRRLATPLLDAIDEHSLDTIIPHGSPYNCARRASRRRRVMLRQVARYGGACGHLNVAQWAYEQAGGNIPLADTQSARIVQAIAQSQVFCADYSQRSRERRRGSLALLAASCICSGGIWRENVHSDKEHFEARDNTTDGTTGAVDLSMFLQGRGARCTSRALSALTTAADKEEADDIIGIDIGATITCAIPSVRSMGWFHPLHCDGDDSISSSVTINQGKDDDGSGDEDEDSDDNGDCADGDEDKDNGDSQADVADSDYECSFDRDAAVWESIAGSYIADEVPIYNSGTSMDARAMFEVAAWAAVRRIIYTQDAHELMRSAIATGDADAVMRGLSILSALDTVEGSPRDWLCTSLVLMAAGGHLSLLRWAYTLLADSAGVCADHTDHVLGIAARHGRVAVAAWLLSRTCPVRATAKGAQVALDVALGCGHARLVRWLVKHARVERVDVQAIRRALSRGHIDLVRWLRRLKLDLS